MSCCHEFEQQCNHICEPIQRLKFIHFIHMHENGSFLSFRSDLENQSKKPIAIGVAFARPVFSLGSLHLPNVRWEKSHKNLDKSVVFSPLEKSQQKKPENVEKTHSCKSLELPHLFLCLEFFVSLCLLMPRKLDQNMSSCGETKFDFAILQWLDKKNETILKKNMPLKTCRNSRGMHTPLNRHKRNSIYLSRAKKITRPTIIFSLQNSNPAILALGCILMIALGYGLQSAR